MQCKTINTQDYACLGHFPLPGGWAQTQFTLECNDEKDRRGGQILAISPPSLDHLFPFFPCAISLLPFSPLLLRISSFLLDHCSSFP